MAAVGPAYAGLGADVHVALGSGGAASASDLTASAASAATSVTVTVAGAPVAEWDRPDCPPGPSCTVPVATTAVDVRIDLTAVAAGTQLPVTVTAAADGVTPARADLTVTALGRPVGLQFFAVDQGAVAIAANTVVGCVPEPGAACAVDNNNETRLARLSVGPGAVDSSSADLRLPAGATVRFAELQWGGNPADAPDPTRLGTVQLVTPAGRTVSVQATSVRMAAGGGAYTAHADVTAAVRALADANGTYTVVDVQTGEGAAQFGGWALIVAYRAPELPRSAIAVFDDPSTAVGALRKVDRSADVVYSLPGVAPPAQDTDVQLGVVAYEGDRTITGETVSVGKVVAGGTDNFFSSTIAVGGAARDPSFSDQYGFDAHLETVAKAFRPGDAAPTVTIHIGGGNDGVFLGAVTMVVAT